MAVGASDSWVVFVIASVTLGLFTRHCEHGPSYTYAWLWLGLLSWLLGSDDAKALFYLAGFGLVVGWYAIQLVQRDIWARILVYWSCYFPKWCVSPAVRLGDMLIHVAPFVLSLDFYDKVQPRHVVQAVLYERIYFYAVEGVVIGNGRIVNKIYALQPPCTPDVFRSLQMLSTVGYFIAASVCAPTNAQRQFLQLLWLGVFMIIAISNTDWLPPDKLRGLLAESLTWDEVNEKFLCYISSLKDTIQQSSKFVTALETTPSPKMGSAGTAHSGTNPMFPPGGLEPTVLDLFDRIRRLETLVASLRHMVATPPNASVAEQGPETPSTGLTSSSCEAIGASGPISDAVKEPIFWGGVSSPVWRAEMVPYDTPALRRGR